MIREKIKEICDNVDKFEDNNYYLSYSCEYRYKNIQIGISLLWFWKIQGFEKLELRIKEEGEYFSDCNLIKLSQKEKKYIFNSFKKVIKEKKEKFKNKTDKWSLEKKKKENDLLNSINFNKKESND